jgi:glucose/arabinose dehydrogenase
LVVVALVLLTACASDKPSDKQSQEAATTTTTTTSSTTTSATPAVRGVKLTEVGRFNQPVVMALRGSDPYIAEKTGRVRRMADGSGGPPAIDVSGNLSLGAEQGLIGLVFSPDGSKAYINYTDRKGDTHIAEHDMAAGPTALRDLLFVDQPFANHNGGAMVFGPDGLLYVGLGDGGSAEDPMDNAQNPNTPLGKILRFRLPDTKPEQFARGLRNPWRITFDSKTGDLWIADVGQDHWEEIDVDRAPVEPGRDYGWPQREGGHRLKSPTRPPGAIEPEYEYGHLDGNCSVTGGYVYRGQALASLLDGAFLFADYCVGQLYALRDGGQADDLKLHVDAPSSFGQDAAGELYVLSLKGPVYRLDPVT